MEDWLAKNQHECMRSVDKENKHYVYNTQTKQAEGGRRRKYSGTHGDVPISILGLSQPRRRRTRKAPQ